MKLKRRTEITRNVSRETGPTKAPGKRPRRGQTETILVRNDDHRHHCQGHRLAIVIGSHKDNSIGAAADWIHGLANVQHKLFFETPKNKQPDLNKPQVPDGQKWKAFPATTNDPLKDFLGTCSCCCHWDEVILVCHGGQKNIWYTLLKNLPRLLGDRPVRKFVLWMCNSAREFSPLHPGTYEGKNAANKTEKLKDVNLFEQIAYFLRPNSCSVTARCDCTHDNCICKNADGGNVPAHCPDGTEAVTLVCAAWYKVTMQDGTTVISRPAALGLDWTTDGQGQRHYELTSPDGNVRQVTIKPDGTVTTGDPAPSANIFAGTPLKEDKGLRDDTDESTAGLLSAKQRKQSTTTEAPNPDPTPPYNGPKRCNHPEHEGCQPDPI